MADTGQCQLRVAKTLLDTYSIKFRQATCSLFVEFFVLKWAVRPRVRVFGFAEP